MERYNTGRGRVAIECAPYVDAKMPRLKAGAF
jgi:hypothetical protein